MIQESSINKQKPHFTMSTKLMTVVVPVYKVEKYIAKCLDSLILPEEWMDRLEVLVVNDGTPDRSAEMAREYEVRYPGTFRVIDKPNGGHGSAWNRGLAEATGKYLRFLDSDDWYTTSEFIKLLEELEHLDVDIAISNYSRYYVQNETFKPQIVKGMTQSVIYDAAELNWDQQVWDIASFWRCSYRTAMLQTIQPMFVEKVFYDDIKVTIASVILAKTACYIDLTIYNYLIGRPGQTMTPEIQRKNYLHKFTVQKDVFEFYLSHPVTGQGRNAYLGSKIKAWLLFEFYQLTRFPYKASKKYLAEWKTYYLRLAKKIGLHTYPINSIKLYFLLPFPLYYYSRKLKDSLTGGDKGLGYDTWAQ